MSIWQAKNGEAERLRNWGGLLGWLNERWRYGDWWRRIDIDSAWNHQGNLTAVFLIYASGILAHLLWVLWPISFIFAHTYAWARPYRIIFELKRIANMSVEPIASKIGLIDFVWNMQRVLILRSGIYEYNELIEMIKHCHSCFQFALFRTLMLN